MSTALLIVIAAPSGAGKSTLCDLLLSEFDNIVYSVSCTTRPPRGEEIDGEDYFFLTEHDFEEKIMAGEFLEYAEVHGNMYGTLRETVDSIISEGNSVIMDIDVQGARQIRRFMEKASDNDILKNGFIDIFIVPPSIEDLRLRLEGRGEDQPDVIEKRLENAVEEMACENEFSCVIVNDDLELAYRKLRDIVSVAMR